MSRLCGLSWMPACWWMSLQTRRKSRSSKTKARSAGGGIGRGRAIASAISGVPGAVAHVHLEPMPELAGAEGARVQEPLHLVATDFAQQAGLRIGLHALGDHRQVEVAGDQRDRA